MREIKFRAWSVLDETMFKDINNHKADTWAVGPGNVKIMQFTELKDNDGKEIYEGDIMYVMGTGNCPVMFYEGSFVLWEGYNAWTSFLDDFEGDISMKVLGNIYENPELLNDAIVATDEGGSK